MPYKRPQIVRTLESLIENESIRDVDPTTKRLVTRCLSGDWCVQFRTSAAPNAEQRKFSMWEGDVRRGESPGLDAVSSAPAPHSAGPVVGSGGMKASLDRMGSLRGKNGKASRSAEHLPLPGTSSSPPKARSHQDARLRADEQPYRVSSRAVPSAAMRHGSGDSASSLPRVAAAAANPHSAAVKHRHRAGSVDVEGTTNSFASLSTRERVQELPHIIDDASPLVEEPIGGSPPEIRVLSPTSPGQVAPLSPTERTFTLSSSASTTSSSSSSKGTATSAPASPQRRAPPPPPVKKRRKPPAVPVGRSLGTAGGGPLSALAASSQPNLADLSAGARKVSGF